MRTTYTGKTPCAHCRSLERVQSGQCPCRLGVPPSETKSAGPLPPKPTKPRKPRKPEPVPDVELEPGTVTVGTEAAASFLAWVPRSEIAVVWLEMRRAGADTVQVTVTPAVAWSLWSRRYGR